MLIGSKFERGWMKLLTGNLPVNLVHVGTWPLKCLVVCVNMIPVLAV